MEQIEWVYLGKGLSAELKSKRWDPVGVELNLKIFFEYIHTFSLSEQSRLIKSNFSKFFYAHPAVVYFLKRTKNYSLLHELDPLAINKLLNEQIEQLVHSLKYKADDEFYFHAIDVLKHILTHLSTTELDFCREKLYKLMLHPEFSPVLFLRLFEILDLPRLQKVTQARYENWKKLFLLGLELGDINKLFDALSEWVTPAFNFYYLNYLEHDGQLKQHLKPILNLSGSELTEYVAQLIKAELKQRLIPLKSDKPTIQHFIESIKDEKERGMSLRKLALLEKANPNHLEQIELFKALEEQNLEKLEQLIQKADIEPWDKLLNGDTLLGAATAFFQLKKGALEQLEGKKFYFAFHKLAQARLTQHLQMVDWQKVMDIFAEVAFRSNAPLSKMSETISFGLWTLPADFYYDLLKIYLPVEQHEEWRKFCPPRDEDQKHEDMQKWLRGSFKGTQESYGLWFQLMSNRTLQAIRSGITYEDLVLLLGTMRSMAALFMQNIQIKNSKGITGATRTEQEHIDKGWPGSPLNFGVKAGEWKTYQTTINNWMRKYYLLKINDLIRTFKRKYLSTLSWEPGSPLVKTSGYKKIKTFKFKGKEISVYPGSTNLFGEDKLALAITCPLDIQEKRVTGTHIVVNWPVELPYFYPQQNPIWIHPLVSNSCMWVHVSGEDKQAFDAEIPRLFKLLIKPEEENFEKNLARFMYLFSQSLIYIRGTAAIGLVLLNALLRLHGRTPPDSPPPLYYLDCEAMCETEKEFTTDFIKWINRFNS